MLGTKIQGDHENINWSKITSFIWSLIWVWAKKGTKSNRVEWGFYRKYDKANKSFSIINLKKLCQIMEFRLIIDYLVWDEDFLNFITVDPKLKSTPEEII